jgi:hypothetical protein
MSQMLAIRTVKLNERHLRPGRTQHTVADNNGRREFPPFVELKITQYQGETATYLMHICEDGSVADTWHENLEDAYHQAEWEFGVGPDEWIEINEPW